MARQDELPKYVRTYRDQPNYKISDQRLAEARRVLSIMVANHIRRFDKPPSILDIGCGRGEIITMAQMEFQTVGHGTEIVPELYENNDDVTYAWAHDLPFKDESFDIVTCLDVLEHIPRDDIEGILSEFKRVAKYGCYITVSNKPSFNEHGDDLHITRLPYVEWDTIFRAELRDKWVPQWRDFPVTEAWICELV